MKIRILSFATTLFLLFSLSNKSYATKSGMSEEISTIDSNDSSLLEEFNGLLFRQKKKIKEKVKKLYQEDEKLFRASIVTFLLGNSVWYSVYLSRFTGIFIVSSGTIGFALISLSSAIFLLWLSIKILKNLGRLRKTYEAKYQ